MKVVCDFRRAGSKCRRRCGGRGGRKARAEPEIAGASVDMLRRPWPPLYHHYPNEWRECYAPLAPRDKGRDYYLLAPLYRDALPPPPPPPPPLNLPRRHLLAPPSCACPCLHRARSRSLDHVDSAGLVRSDEESDHYQSRHPRPRHPGKENYLKRRSMENLLDTRPPRRRAPRPVRTHALLMYQTQDIPTPSNTRCNQDLLYLRLT